MLFTKTYNLFSFENGVLASSFNAVFNQQSFKKIEKKRSCKMSKPLFFFRDSLAIVMNTKCNAQEIADCLTSR